MDMTSGDLTNKGFSRRYALSQISTSLINRQTHENIQID